MRKIQIFIPVALLASALFAERQPFERYETILDRQMFGPPPPGFDPTKMPSEVSSSSSRGKATELSKEQEQMKSAIRFSAINAKADGTVLVGFTDNSNAKSPRHHYLKVGETSEDGWLVKEADATKETMTIEKDGVEVSLSLGGSTSGGGSAGKSADSGAGNRPGLLAGGGSLMRRRSMRREEEARREEARREEDRKAREEERRKEEEESAQRALEREEQRKQLLQIQEELRRTREEREARNAANAGAGGDQQDQQ